MYKLLGRNLILIGILISCVFNTFGPLPVVYGQEFLLPKPGNSVQLSPAFHPPILKGIKVHKNNPLKFEFILNPGESKLTDELLKGESKKLVKYFLASMTVPEKDLWVNLSPYEKNRIIPEGFGQTEMGRDLLAQDYLLKQITSTLMYPEEGLGKQFWKRIYEAAAKQGSTNVPVNTFNKVWIVPDKAKVYEQINAAFIVNSRLKVMLEEDYLALNKNQNPIFQSSYAMKVKATQGNPQTINQKLRSQTSQLIFAKAPQVKHQTQNTSNPQAEITKQIIRDIIIPELEKEVNEGQNFAPLRQVYHSLILAQWFKRKMKQSILSKAYIDQNKVQGTEYIQSISSHHKPGDIDVSQIDLIYQQYLKAFKQGVYNYIKEERDPLSQKVIPRKYFAGGMKIGAFKVGDLAMITDSRVVTNEEGNLAVHVDLAMVTKSRSISPSKRRELIARILKKQKNPITPLELFDLMRRYKNLSEVNKVTLRHDISRHEELRNHPKLKKQLDREKVYQRRDALLKILNSQVRPIDSTELRRIIIQQSGFEMTTMKDLMRDLKDSRFKDHPQLKRIICDAMKTKKRRKKLIQILDKQQGPISNVELFKLLNKEHGFENTTIGEIYRDKKYVDVIKNHKNLRNEVGEVIRAERQKEVLKILNMQRESITVRELYNNLIKDSRFMKVRIWSLWKDVLDNQEIKNHFNLRYVKTSDLKQARINELLKILDSQQKTIAASELVTLASSSKVLNKVKPWTILKYIYDDQKLKKHPNLKQKVEQDIIGRRNFEIAILDRQKWPITRLKLARLMRENVEYADLKDDVIFEDIERDIRLRYHFNLVGFYDENKMTLIDAFSDTRVQQFFKNRLSFPRKQLSIQEVRQYLSSIGYNINLDLYLYYKVIPTLFKKAMVFTTRVYRLNEDGIVIIKPRSGKISVFNFSRIFNKSQSLEGIVVIPYFGQSGNVVQFEVQLGEKKHIIQAVQVVVSGVGATKLAFQYLEDTLERVVVDSAPKSDEIVALKNDRKILEGVIADYVDTDDIDELNQYINFLVELQESQIVIGFSIQDSIEQAANESGIDYNNAINFLRYLVSEDVVKQGVDAKMVFSKIYEYLNDEDDLAMTVQNSQQVVYPDGPKTRTFYTLIGRSDSAMLGSLLKDLFIKLVKIGESGSGGSKSTVADPGRRRFLKQAVGSAVVASIASPVAAIEGVLGNAAAPVVSTMTLNPIGAQIFQGFFTEGIGFNPLGMIMSTLPSGRGIKYWEVDKKLEMYSKLLKQSESAITRIADLLSASQDEIASVLAKAQPKMLESFERMLVEEGLAGVEENRKMIDAVREYLSKSTPEQLALDCRLVGQQTLESAQSLATNLLRQQADFRSKLDEKLQNDPEFKRRYEEYRMYLQEDEEKRQEAIRDKDALRIWEEEGGRRFNNKQANDLLEEIENFQFPLWPEDIKDHDDLYKKVGDVMEAFDDRIRDLEEKLPAIEKQIILNELSIAFHRLLSRYWDEWYIVHNNMIKQKEREDNLAIDAFINEGGSVKIDQDKAMNSTPIDEKGGIDLTSDKALAVKNDGNAEITFDAIDPVMLKQIQDSKGFEPIINRIEPIVDLKQFLGIKQPESLAV